MKIEKISYLLFISLFFLVKNTIQSQNLDLEAIPKAKKFKVVGNISANSVYYQSNNRQAREPFTYFLQGNLTVSWFTFSMPISYSFTNQGKKMSYKVPFDFNRLSLHPKYKFVQAHIGNVSMSFSPYTLNGHQFTGGGVDLTPKGAFKFSAMYGRLLKPIEDDGKPQTIPSFKRIGFGTKLVFEKEKYKLGLITFYAKDDINSIHRIPEEKNIKPKENVVIGLEGETTIAKNYNVKVEYASTAITQDLRSENSNKKNVKSAAGFFIKNKLSTEYYNALKASFNVKLAKTQVGMGYEYIDPKYETLGAYYFNNDLENITLNMSRPLFNNKMNISFNVGYQRDNLKKQKKQETSRKVGSVNITYQLSEVITLTGVYSNFSTFTNKSLNQFDDVNDNDLTDEEQEALNFKQLSQNANASIDWILQQTEDKTQNINLNYSLAASANVENEIIRKGQANNFHNTGATYLIGFPKKTLNISTSLNYNYSDIGKDDSQTWGTTVNVNKTFFENILNTTFGTSYNQSNSKSDVVNILNLRLAGTIKLLKKHNFNLAIVQLFKKTTSHNALNELTATFGYNYNFTVKKPKIKFPNLNKKVKEFQFSYKQHKFKGTHKAITDQVLKVSKSNNFRQITKIGKVRNDLELLALDMRKNENQKDAKYKKKALNYLKYLYQYQNFMGGYNKMVFQGLKKLYKDASKLNFSLKKEYELSVLAYKRSYQHLKSEQEMMERKEKKYKAHMWMMEQLKKVIWEDIVEDVGFLQEFKSKNIETIFELSNKTKDNEQILNYVEVKLADFYHKKSYEVKDYELLKVETR